ncbi:MAG: 30S ribosomal protein S8 [Candidatus Anstonellales archaeon]
MSVDLLAEAMNIIKTNSQVGKSRCTVKYSNLILKVLEIMKSNGYVESFEVIEDGKGNKINVKLSGKINNCGVIKPRAPVKRQEWYKAEEQYLPGVGIGIIIVSTPKGIMTNREAEERKLGGRMIGFVY